MTKTIRPGTVIENVDIIEIKRILPHRYPILMIDRVENIVPDISATGIKNVTSNEPVLGGIIFSVIIALFSIFLITFDTRSNSGL